MRFDDLLREVSDIQARLLRQRRGKNLARLRPFLEAGFQRVDEPGLPGHPASFMDQRCAWGWQFSSITKAHLSSLSLTDWLSARQATVS